MTIAEENKLIQDTPLPFRPLDFVSPVDHPDCIGIVTEVTSNMYSENTYLYSASVTWLGNIPKSKGLKSAWWLETSLILVDSLPRILLKTMAHPFGHGAKYIDKAFPK